MCQFFGMIISVKKICQKIFCEKKMIWDLFCLLNYNAGVFKIKKDSFKQK